jgi:hypothetical protein
MDKMIDVLNPYRRECLTNHFNTFLPNVLTAIILDYDYYYNENECSTITPSEFNIDRLGFKSIQYDTIVTQFINFINYLYNHNLEPTKENIENKGRSLIVVTKPIKITKGGIPRYDYVTKYLNLTGPDDTRRGYFYIPKNDDSKELFDMVQKIDDYLYNEINIRHNANDVLMVSYQGKSMRVRGVDYCRMITTWKPSEEDDWDQDQDQKQKQKQNQKKKYDAWDRIKVKFSTTYDKNLGYDDPKEINTKLYIGDNPDPEPCARLSDYEKHFKLGSTIQFALMFSKLWISSNPKQCGICIKCVQLCVTKKSHIVNIYKSGRMFAKSNTSK